MADLYLCGNGSDIPTDVTLRGVAPCSPTTGGAAPGVFGRLPAPNVRRTGLVQIVIEVSGEGSARHRGTARPVVLEAATGRAAASMSGTSRVDVSATSRATAVAAHTTPVTVRASGPDPTEDELFLLDLLG